MKVYALIGSSGTGKSHHAQAVAYRENIDTILDDGLLIQGSRIIAGRSAKREPTRMQAVRRAIFMDSEHAEAVKVKLAEIKPERLLVITTSDRMFQRIADRLQLPAPTKIIQIEEVANSKQIARARKAREREGKHVIPVPAIEVKRNLPGILVDPLKYVFPRIEQGRPPRRGEKSIVRPTFSYIGRLAIGEGAVRTIARELAKTVPGVLRVIRVGVQEEKYTMRLGIDISIDGLVYIPAVLAAVQHTVKQEVEEMTGLEVQEVNVTARTLVLAHCAAKA
ncbi:MAG: Asp23/Gls24 family envelope stress response protein [Firmicutes bacterium]|nr:Asp23/Gls24 family envelope stress response protein [Bacillota bacterium]